MILAIHQPQYIPWLGYFHKIASCDTFVLYDDVQYKKNEWINRNQVKTANGPLWLTVPVSYQFPQLINQVRIGIEPKWQYRQIRTLEESYRRAPFAKDYLPALAAVLEKPWPTIADLNMAVIKLMMEWLGIKTPLVLSSGLNIQGKATERIINICRHLGADTYLAGKGGHDYMETELFAPAGVKLLFQEFTHPVYSQVVHKQFPDFISNLSALDLIFNCGPESGKIVRAV